ncbi:putative bifunctional diguanylate cyclase/phosphodiesterase [Aquisalimonas asiatica]|uniref:Diguanylate cyclase (GGDEF) domain-containing protein n=1 Tax=Aquisalimonas asiatica TaxID=406100 RepID=A0A1H8PL65_9GAMM|nr:EAL domain-containing protein [Aquisalimonas asiatica]SEO42467.1 diguanylate cyclase (GGDEF) domain-containing protein [Aquisalimonas asiatica]
MADSQTGEPDALSAPPARYPAGVEQLRERNARLELFVRLSTQAVADVTDARALTRDALTQLATHLRMVGVFAWNGPADRMTLVASTVPEATSGVLRLHADLTPRDPADGIAWADAFRSLDTARGATGLPLAALQSHVVLNCPVTETLQLAIGLVDSTDDPIAPEDVAYAASVLNLLALIHAQEQRQNEATSLAYTDPLTGIANRRAFIDQANRHMALARRENRAMGLLFIDLNRFKEVNDSLGHSVGDDLLNQITARISRICRTSDLLARLGGDEFGLLLPLTGADGALAMAARIHDALLEPFDLAGEAIQCGTSVGVAVFPDHGETVDDLQQAADTAMYSAKHSQEPTRVYRPPQGQSAHQALLVGQRLRRLIGGEEGAIALHCQPLVALDDGTVREFEVLSRLDTQDMGRLTPDHFIPVAERNGLIVDLDRLVLKQTVSAMADTDTVLSVNIAAPTLYHADFPAYIGTLLADAGVAPHRLYLEITERVVTDPGRALTALEALSSAGVRIALDDFGTGYSSLTVLADLPIHRIKIDRRFIQQLGTEPPLQRAIIESVVAMADGLGVSLVAEGIETDTQEQAVRDHGIRLAQGYRFGRPEPMGR